MLLMLSAAPVLWEGDSGLKFRDLVVEFSRWVLVPRVPSRVDHRHPPTGRGEVNLLNNYGCASWDRTSFRQEGPPSSCLRFRHYALAIGQRKNSRLLQPADAA